MARVGKRAPGLALAGLLCAHAAWACPTSGYDPALVQAWADGIAGSERGPLDVARPELGLASHGRAVDALGPADGDPVAVFSLGDGGWLTAHLSAGIWDGPGDDFAVYENGFWSAEGLFAEFAYVEVSSNGTDFARFAVDTRAVRPVPDFGSVDPCDYDNLAGDKPLGEGSGFDLAELASLPLVSSGRLDLDRIHYVRLIDVIGDGSTSDAEGMPVYDPYPTPFATGGFDVQAIGALHAPEPGLPMTLLFGCAGVGLLARPRTAARGTAAACAGRR